MVQLSTASPRKYVCKPEMEMSKGLSNMVKNIINVGHHTGLGLRGILQKNDV